MKDYYYILGVDSGDTIEVIRKAYRKLSQKFHPDKNDSDEFFENRFKKINEAYEVLSDSTKRSIYDHIRIQGQSYNSQTNNFIPIIKFFQSDRPEFEYDKEITIRWKTVNADFVKLNPFGNVDPIGEKKYKLKSLENEYFTIELIATNTYIGESVTSILKIKNKTYQNFYKKIKDDFLEKDSESKKFNYTNKNNLEPLIPYRRGNKWGFCTIKKLLVIDFIYDEVCQFQEGLAAIRKGNKWGYIGQTGAEIINCKYDSAFPFKEELGLVVLNKQCGFINKSGEEVVPFIYLGATYFNSGFAGVRKFSFFQKILLKLKLVSRRLYLHWNIYTSDDNKSYKIIDKKNKQVFPEIYNLVRGFQEGYSAVKLKGKYGYIDNKGKMVIHPKFYTAYDFSEGLAAVKLFESYTAQLSAIFIDKEGNTKLRTKYNNVYSFQDGLALVETFDDYTTKYGFIDKNGKEVISCKYDSAGSFFEGLAYIGIGKVSDLRKFGFINKNDEIIIPCKYQVVENFKNNLAKVKFNNKFGYIDKNGTEFWED